MSTPSPIESSVDNIPLFVDLDGTLIKTDLLIESAFTVLKKQPWLICLLFVWLITGGKARLKAELAQRAELDVSVLPYQQEFLDYLKAQAQLGRVLILATASYYSLAQLIAEHLGIFQHVLATDKQTNLAGSRKLEAILAYCNHTVFDYAGNAKVDIAIWAASRQIIVVNAHNGVLATLKKQGYSVFQVFEDRPSTLKTWLRALRIHQWSKNVLLFVPVLTSHSFKLTSLIEISVSFISFGLIASATYLLNDLLDLVADRHHPRKCKRPFAAGNLSLLTGIIAMLLLFGLGFSLANYLSPLFLLTLFVYLVLTISYSFYFKKIMLVDVLLLAALYTIRIIAGAFAIEVPVTSWLLVFSMFIFLSLALVKRCTELLEIKRLSRNRLKGRDYHISDYAILSTMGVASAYLSILVLALFISDHTTITKYTHPTVLWLLCPLMTYWLSRVWLKTSRGKMHDDPLVYAIKDRISWIVFSSIILVIYFSI